jgi:hypothetical protein
VAIAVKATEAQVIERCIAAVFFGADMVYFVGLACASFVQQAVFTAPLCYLVHAAT